MHMPSIMVRGQFVLMSTRTYFVQSGLSFRSTNMLILLVLVNSYSIWSISSHFGQFVLVLSRVRIDQNEYDLTKLSTLITT